MGKQEKREGATYKRKMETGMCGVIERDEGEVEIMLKEREKGEEKRGRRREAEARKR